MAINDLRVPSAKQNPLDMSRVPEQPLAVQFAIRTRSLEAERRHVQDTTVCIYFAAVWSVLAMDTLFPWSTRVSTDVCWMLILLFVAYTFTKSINARREQKWSGLTSIVAIVLLSFIFPWIDAGGPNLWLLAVLLFMAYFFTSGLDFQRPNSWAESMFRHLLPVGIGIVAIVGVMQAIEATAILPLACGALTLLQGIAFREHTLERAVTGMLDDTTARNFLVWKTLPKGLKPEPRLYGLLAAIRCYLSYNIDRVRTPGTFQTSVGSLSFRVGLSLAVICTMSVCIYVSFVPEVARFSRLMSEEHGSVLPQLMPILFVAISPLLAIAIWAVTLFLFTANFIGRAFALKKKQVSSSHWRRMLDRMDTSENKHERDSLWVGWCSCDNSPILYPVSQLFRHVWVSGGSGSGKTAWMMGVIDQLIYRTDVQVIVIDCKANNCEILPMMQRAANARQKKQGSPTSVKHFTLKEGEATYLLDVFSQSWWQNLPVPQRTGTILSALSLNYASVFGESYYRDAAYEFLSFVLDRHPDVSSWVELIRRMQEAIASAKPWELSKSCKEDGEHVVWIVKRLSSLSALNNSGSLPQGVRDNAIDFADGHHYFALNPRENGLLTGEVGRLIVACVLSAAYANRALNKRTVLVCDEWQLVVTRELEEILTQSRDLNVGCLLSNQNAAQLVTKDVDLVPIVEGNTALNAWMQITDNVGREQIRRLGGEEVDVKRSASQNHAGELSQTFSETIQDRVNGNLVDAVSADPTQFLLRLCGSAGYACYRNLVFTARTMFHQTRVLYEQDVNETWPVQTSETLVNHNALPRHNPTPTTAQSVAPKKTRRGGNRLGQPTNQ